MALNDLRRKRPGGDPHLVDRALEHPFPAHGKWISGADIQRACAVVAERTGVIRRRAADFLAIHIEMDLLGGIIHRHRDMVRSEERRVGKERKERWMARDSKNHAEANLIQISEPRVVD